MFSSCHGFVRTILKWRSNPHTNNSVVFSRHTQLHKPHHQPIPGDPHPPRKLLLVLTCQCPGRLTGEVTAIPGPQGTGKFRLHQLRLESPRGANPTSYCSTHQTSGELGCEKRLGADPEVGTVGSSRRLLGGGAQGRLSWPRRRCAPRAPASRLLNDTHGNGPSSSARSLQNVGALSSSASAPHPVTPPSSCSHLKGDYKSEIQSVPSSFSICRHPRSNQ